MRNPPIQSHPFDVAGKVLVNKEWYLWILALVNELGGTSNSDPIGDIQLLEAVDASTGSEGTLESSIAALEAVDASNLIDESNASRAVADLLVLQGIDTVDPTLDQALRRLDSVVSGIAAEVSADVTEGLSRAIADMLVALHTLAPSDPTEQLIAQLRQIEVLLALMPEHQDQQHGGPLSSISVTASPFTYTASVDGTVYVMGGTVTDLTLGRGTSSFSTGITSGSLFLNANDTLKVTYTAAPTMELVPR